MLSKTPGPIFVPGTRSDGGPPWRSYDARQGGPASVKPASTMGKNVRVAPSEQVELGPDGQKFEARPGKVRPALPGEHAVELLPQGVEVQHVGRGVVHLSLAQGLGAPVGRLLLLRQLDP